MGNGFTLTLCGSARFELLFHAWNEALTVCGHTVFTLTAFPSVKGRKDWYTPEVKVLLDQAHKRKIAKSDGIVVLNNRAYLGESTMSEIEHAKSLCKLIFYLESWGEGMGIGPHHTEAVQADVRAWGFETPPRSPIDTFAGHGQSYPFTRGVWDLLGPAGALRSALVAERGPLESARWKVV